MGIKTRGADKFDVELRGRHVKRVYDHGTALMLYHSGKRQLELGKPLHEVIEELRGGRPTVTPSFSQQSKVWLAEQTCSSQSVKVYGQMLAYAEPHIGRLPISEIDHTVLKRLTATLDKQYSPQVVRQCVSKVKSVLNDACDDGLITTRPPRKVKGTPRLDRIRPGFALNRSQHDAIVAAAQPRYRDLFDLWPWIGLRLGEVAGLRSEDVDVANRKLRVVQQVKPDGSLGPPKFGKKRTIELSDPALEILERMPRETVALFPSHTGDYLGRSTIGKWCRTTAEASGIRFHSHIFRHTCGSWLIEGGRTIPYVARFLGDTIEVITTTYVHEIEDADKRGMKRFNAWANGDTEGTDESE